ncbi:hypothetical protein O5D80_000102 [Batrachochytrium dendrobatidis]|nr:hypothetical protein O5D80_000102 [Batrachochytrium dendrobatidis]
MVCINDAHAAFASRFALIERDRAVAAKTRAVHPSSSTTVQKRLEPSTFNKRLDAKTAATLLKQQQQTGHKMSNSAASMMTKQSNGRTKASKTISVVKPLVKRLGPKPGPIENRLGKRLIDRLGDKPTAAGKTKAVLRSKKARKVSKTIVSNSTPKSKTRGRVANIGSSSYSAADMMDDDDYKFGQAAIY